jgi:CelD/BcsL family acetyltransferase involved in cellulose biosynthesis
LLELDRTGVADDAEVGVQVAASKPAACELTIVEGPDAIAQVENDWRELARNGGIATPFQSFSVATAAANAHLRRNELPRIVVARKVGRPVVIFPTVITCNFGFPVVRFLGDPLIQYGDVISGQDATPDDFTAACMAAADPRISCLALFRRVRDDAKAARALAQRAKVCAVQESPLVHVGQRSRLRAREARELRRLRRRLAEHGALEVRFVSGPQALELLLQAFELKRGWMNAQGLWSPVIGELHWEEALCDLCRLDAEKGGLVVAALTVDGRPAALEAAFADDVAWYAFLGAFSLDFARMGPGQILTAECIAHTHDVGLSIYDQLPPSQPYKRRQASGSIAVRDYALMLTPRGRLAFMTIRMFPKIKMLFTAIPIELRRPMLSLYSSLMRSSRSRTRFEW